MKWTKQGKASGAAHIAPLPEQAILVLSELHALTGNGRFLFPSVSTKDQPMSDNTINAAWRRRSLKRSSRMPPRIHSGERTTARLTCRTAAK
ncbi:integrase [Burkholderia lata]|nr:integrase [Burkholderia lata]